MKLMGLDLITDYGELADLASKGNEAVHTLDYLIPGMTEAIREGIRHLESQRYQATRMTYLNFRLQVWERPMYDTDSSPPVRLIPRGVAL